MNYIELNGGNKIEVTEKEAFWVKDQMKLVNKPSNIEVSGHMIRLSSIKDVYYGQKREEESNKYHQMILDWEDEIRERRNYPIPEKISYTRFMMASVWKAMHNQDIQAGRGYIPEEIWDSYSQIAEDFFGRHPKRIYVDSHLWLHLFKPNHQITIFGQQIMEAIIRTIGNERELARKDGEPQDLLPEGPSDVPESLESHEKPKDVSKVVGTNFASVGAIIEGTAPVTRERNSREDWGIEEEDISIDSIPF